MENRWFGEIELAWIDPEDCYYDEDWKHLTNMHFSENEFEQEDKCTFDVMYNVLSHELRYTELDLI